MIDRLFAADPVIVSHALAAIAALLIGSAQLIAPKGVATHRALGYVWAGLMLFVAGSSFWIHEIRMLGPWSPIHILSIVVLVTVPAAVIAARAGRIKTHRNAMAQLYVFALVITGAFTLLPGRLMHEIVFGP